MIQGPGHPRTITDAQVEEVVVRTLEEAPEAGTHWSQRELAKAVGISPASVLRIWHAFGLQPWRTETFKISPDPQLVDKVRDTRVLHGLTSTLLALGLAALAVTRPKLLGERSWTAPLRRLQSGHIGDYVAWMLMGTTLLAVLA